MPSSIQFNTAHNVNISVPLATLWQRIGACMTDNFIKAGYAILIIFMLNEFSDFSYAITIFFLPVMFYSFLFEKFYDGQTPGKQVVGIKVVSLNGSNVNTGQHLMRWLFRLIDINILSGLVAILSIAIGEKGQRIGDMIAGTSVIDIRKNSLSQVDRFQNIDENYIPKYEGAKQLNAKEVRLIKEILDNRSENRFELITKLAAKVESSLHIQKDDSSELFLKTLLKDHQYYKTNYLSAPIDKDDFV